MFEELVEVLVGPWGLAAVLLLATQGGRKMVRTAAKEVVKVGMIATEKAKEVAAEIQEEASDVIAEAHAERNEKSKAPVASTSSKRSSGSHSSTHHSS